MAKKGAKQRDDDTIAVNRRARFDYEVLDTVEAGLALRGTEVKSLRAGKVSLQHAFATIKEGEAWLLQADIPEYQYGNIHNHWPTRERKLLLHRAEIERLAEFSREAGRTLVPLKMYWKDGKAKVLVGLARGKAQHDKRRDLAEKDAKRQVERTLAQRAKGKQ
ncbi:SsrA-binding protein SmpB [Egibacter rhizosphaerae]|uniref:SsrA-binding protein n=1 Tax=Egibacter rhizosphaerae TaxID=1670831 RepID=A0A411YC73_9ACTN|nr:SsrA-binding protein SmpB [Egibacter rhizosphaerae]QBI18775.1 SsrA-binding protein SmpB [Egibacter rhizosphaerae]